MEPEPLKNTTTSTRKMRFAPKAPPRRVLKPVVPKNEAIEDTDALQAKDLLRRLNEGSASGKPKLEKKFTPSQVTFGYGGSSSSIKSYGVPKSGSITKNYQGLASTGGGAYASGIQEEKEYQEPWDYYSYYPITLPLRRPYLGNPELLDEEEFGEVPESIISDENPVKPAIDFGLMEDNLEAKMFFLQLPETMPMIKRASSAKGEEATSSPKQHKGAGPFERTCRLDELPGGYMGKMLVYRSGVVKLKLGDTLYDVSSGSDCVFAQDVVAINVEEKHCCVVGELNKRAVVTPDINSILDSMADLG